VSLREGFFSKAVLYVRFYFSTVFLVFRASLSPGALPYFALRGPDGYLLPQLPFCLLSGIPTLFADPVGYPPGTFIHFPASRLVRLAGMDFLERDGFSQIYGELLSPLSTVNSRLLRFLTFAPLSFPYE